jgi:hypothetical protein
MEISLPNHNLEPGTKYYPPNERVAISAYMINDEAKIPYAVNIDLITSPVTIVDNHPVMAAVVPNSDRQGEYIKVSDPTGYTFYVLKDSLLETFSTTAPA